MPLDMDDKDIALVRAKYLGEVDAPDIVAVKDGEVVAEVYIRVNMDADRAWAQRHFQRAEVGVCWHLLFAPWRIYGWRRGSHLGEAPDIEVELGDTIATPGMSPVVFMAIVLSTLQSLATKTERELGPLDVLRGAALDSVESVMIWGPVTELGHMVSARVADERDKAERDKADERARAMMQYRAQVDEDRWRSR
jgi:hypothetical protein